MEFSENERQLIRNMERMKKIPAQLAMRHGEHSVHGEIILLDTIYRMENKGIRVSVSTLKEMTHMHKTMISRVMQNMEDKGWIYREIDPEDRRGILVSTTELGKQICDENARDMHLFITRTMEKMGNEEFGELLKKWSQMMDAMEEVIREDKEKGTDGDQ